MNKLIRLINMPWGRVARVLLGLAPQDCLLALYTVDDGGRPISHRAATTSAAGPL